MSQAQKLVDTFVAEMVKKVGDAADKLLFTAAPAKKKEKKEKEKEGEAAEHADESKPNQAILSKEPGGYAQRGHDFLAANRSSVPNREVSPAGVYQDFSRDYLERIAKLCQKHTAFPGGPVANFNPGARSAAGRKANQRCPYPWEAHHMVPASAFDLKDENDRPAFTDEQKKLLLQTPYDINHGHNIIMLPKLAWGAPVHGLLQHPSDHPEYTKWVIGKLQEVAKRVQKLVKKQPPPDHKDVVANFFERLKKVEDDCWNFLVDLGRSSVAAKCSGRQLDHPDSQHVLYQALTRSTKYEFGRLY